MDEKNKYLLPADEVEVFDEAKYQRNISENGPFTDDAGIGEDE